MDASSCIKMYRSVGVREVQIIDSDAQLPLALDNNDNY